MDSFQALALGLALAVVVLFGLLALAYFFWRRSRTDAPESPEFFLTARRSVGAFTIAWAFYAGAMGSWALFGPPSYPLYAGLLGLIMYSISSGIPILVIGLLGGVIHDLVPNVISFSDFVHRRFGLFVSLYVAAIMLFNMGVALTAEFTAVGDIFEFIIGVSRIPIVVTIGCVSILYTAVGGLFVSIITDQWQAGCSVVFILVLVVYVAVTFRKPLGPLPENLEWGNPYGLVAIAVMPISLTSATLFSEAMWQRCWATTDRKSLVLGSVLGCFLVISAVFILGFGGVLALWGGWVPASPEDTGNTILFSLFTENWVLIIATLLACVMSESAVDSLQNAIVDTVASVFQRSAASLGHAVPALSGPLAFMQNLNLWWVRGLVLALNVVPIIVSLQGYNVLQLFLMANLITTTSVIPIFSGVAQGKVSRRIVTPFSVTLGCLSGLGSLFWWTAIQANRADPPIPYTDALYTTFFTAYDWPPFLIALGASVAGMFLGALLEFIARRCVPSMRHYPDYPLGTGLTGQITEGTAEIMAKAHLESAQYAPDGGVPDAKYAMEGDVFLSEDELPPVEPNVQVQKP